MREERRFFFCKDMIVRGFVCCCGGVVESVEFTVQMPANRFIGFNFYGERRAWRGSERSRYEQGESGGVYGRKCLYEAVFVEELEDESKRPRTIMTSPDPTIILKV